MGERPLTLQELIRRRQSGAFVGRVAQLGMFEENLGLAVEDPRRRFLFTLHGDGGVGKTYLTRQFERLARERGWLTAYVDEAAYDVPSVIETLTTNLIDQGARCKECTERLTAYQRRRHELDADPGAPEGMSSMLTRTVVRVGVRLAGDIPVIGAVTKEVDPAALANQVDQLRVYLSRKFHDHNDVRLVLSPVEVLTPAFVRDLSTIAENRPVVLFFDTYERTGPFLDPWLLDLLAGRYGGLPGNLLLAVAGRDPLDVNKWGDYLGVRADIPLAVFSESEARQLLAARGVTTEAVVAEILAVSGRLPVWVAALAEPRPDTIDDVGDTSGSAVQRFLKWEDDPQRRAAALYAALPRRLDREVFAVATRSESVDADFAWLRRQPFVVGHSDGYRYHDVVRQAMLRELRKLSPADWQRRHSALADHYGETCQALGLADAARWQHEDWHRARLEQRYHQLCAHPTQAVSDALGDLIQAIGGRGALTGVWAEMIHQAGDATDSRSLVQRGKALSAAGNDDKVDVLTILIDGGLDDEQQTSALIERAAAHRRAERYEEALHDLSSALHLTPGKQRAISDRGWVYCLAGRYEEALADFDRAIELNPEYDWAIANRGQTYRLTGRYEDALADLDRAIELNPKYSWAIAQRGETYRLMGRYEDALTDFNRAITLDPEYDWAIVSRGQTHQAMGRHEDARADFDKALELDPNDGWWHYLSAIMLLTEGDADAARDRLVRAVDCERKEIAKQPDDSRHGFNLAVLLLALGEHEEAVRQAQATVERGAWPPLIHEAMQDLEELHEATGHEITGLHELLRSHLPK